MMIKKISALCLSVLLVAPLLAQPGGRSSERSFKPKKGDWQVSLHLGSGSFFKEYDGLNYLLPAYSDGLKGTIDDMGLPGYGGTENQSYDPGLYLNLGASFNDNSIVNIASIQGAYFFTDRIQMTFSASMDMNITPKKDYEESSLNIGNDLTDLPNKLYIEGRMSSKTMVGVGGNYYFPTRTDRVNLYLGVFGGYQMAHIKTSQPYTGELTDPSSSDPDTDVAVFRPGSRLGKVHGVRGAITAGVELSVMESLILGFEIQPASYGYTLLRMQPKGMSSYSAAHHNIRAFTYPTVKLGFRF